MRERAPYLFAAGILLSLFAAALYAIIRDAEMRETAPCSRFEHWTIQHVPARCFHRFAGDAGP
jgi:hypothetical protein